MKQPSYSYEEARDRTLSNLLNLVTHDLITQTAVVVYLFCFVSKEEATPVSLLQERCKLSATIIRHHLEDFETLGLMQIERQVGKPLKIKTLPVTDKRYSSIIDNSDAIDKIKKHRDVKIDKYNPKRKLYIEERDACIQVSTLLHNLPEKYKPFTVTPASQRKLERLSAELDLEGFSLEDYTKWFIKYKLDITVHSFSLGIFYYPGIVTEYKNKKRAGMKKESYKRVALRKTGFDKQAAEFEENLRDSL